MDVLSATRPTCCKICQGKSLIITFSVSRGDDVFDLLDCEECGFRFIDKLDPPVAPPSTKRPISAQDIATGLESNRERIESNIALLRRLKSTGAVLDVGCGGGGFLSAISGGYDRLVGVDLDPRYVAFTRSRGLDVRDYAIEDPRWNDEQSAFDAVTLWDVIEHVNDPLAVLRRARSLLKPAGVILLDTPNRDGLLYRFGAASAWLTRGRVMSTMGMQYSASTFCHKQIFRKSDMRQILERAGFTDVHIEERFELSFPPSFYLRRYLRSKTARWLVGGIAAAALKVLPVRNKLIVSARA